MLADAVLQRGYEVYLLWYSSAMNGKEVIKQLQAHGFSILRINGSHHLLGKGGLRVPVPVHGAKDLKIGTLKNIERLSGVKLT